MFHLFTLGAFDMFPLIEKLSLLRREPIEQLLRNCFELIQE